MTDTNKDANILQYQKRRHLNIGIVIFGIIFIYLVATIVLYLTAPRITAYEVRQGSILKDNAYTGLAIRSETVVYAEDNGYVNYYAENQSKVRVGTRVYTLSDTPLEFETAVSDNTLSLTEEEMHSLVIKMQGAHEQFEESDFSSVYYLKKELLHTLEQVASQSKSDQLNAMLSNGAHSDLTVKTAEKDGIIVYAMDGLEELKCDTVTMDCFDKSDYRKTEFGNNYQISAGDPVYKIITDNNWSLLIKVSDETKAALAEKKRIKVSFKKDNQELWASLSLIEQDGDAIARLSFQDSMIRYVNERFLDVELILEDESGLKIPKTAETTKDFYVVPNTYLTQGGNSSSDGVMRQTVDADGKTITEFLKVTVYYEEDEMIYLDPNAFEPKDVLIKPDSSEVYPLTETRSLQGVYCINKGYAVFKQIRILCESEEYYIIEDGNHFGLSNYDHIALRSENLKENDVVF